MIKLEKKHIDRAKHNPNKELSEKLAPWAAIALLIIIIIALFV